MEATVKTHRMQYLVIATVVMFGLSVLAAAPSPKQNHHNGQQMLGEKIKTNGHHVLHKEGDFTASVEVENGKVAGLHVKRGKEDVAVKKYRSDKKMALAGQARVLNASYHLTQDQYLGTTFVGYSYIDEYGVEQIYWFPADVIVDGVTGAIVFVPAE